ncbi:hypothetical protein Syun_027625 [Stephania yunnanensis]|uniref:Uncharacterized protein n=1 Tax=Stephania yunnanensis TaxID=152371 RepID=A0AAP0HMZ6_9MAGN
MRETIPEELRTSTRGIKQGRPNLRADHIDHESDETGDAKGVVRMVTPAGIIMNGLMHNNSVNSESLRRMTTYKIKYKVLQSSKMVVQSFIVDLNKPLVFQYSGKCGQLEEPLIKLDIGEACTPFLIHTKEEQEPIRFDVVVEDIEAPSLMLNVQHTGSFIDDHISEIRVDLSSPLLASVPYSIEVCANHGVRVSGDVGTCYLTLFMIRVNPRPMVHLVTSLRGELKGTIDLSNTGNPFNHQIRKEYLISMQD